MEKDEVLERIERAFTLVRINELLALWSVLLEAPARYEILDGVIQSSIIAILYGRRIDEIEQLVCRIENLVIDLVHKDIPMVNLDVWLAIAVSYLAALDVALELVDVMYDHAPYRTEVKPSSALVKALLVLALKN